MKMSLAGAIWSVGALIAIPTQAEEPIRVFQCTLSEPLPEGGPRLNASKSFREDGAVNSMYVSWEDSDNGELVRPPGSRDRVSMRLSWPGEPRIGKPEDLFDWSQGFITMHLLLGNAAANFALRKGEQWRQVVVDREQSVITRTEDGARFAFLPSLDMLLMSDFEPTSTPGRLNMSLNAFLAWGSGVPHLTVYEMRVKRRTPARNSYPTSPAGARRIIGAYDVDMAGLERKVALIREATERWERSLSTSWRTCRYTTEGGDLVVTDSGKR